MDARSEILQKIKQGEKDKVNLLQEPEWEEEALVPVSGDLQIVFCNELEAIGSECIGMDSYKDLSLCIQQYISENHLQSVVSPFAKIQQWCSGIVNPLEDEFIEQADAIVTFCECLIAQTGSVVMSSQLSGGRKTWAVPPFHIVVASKKQIVPTIKDALSYLSSKYEKELPSQISMITGSSRTADIEKTLVKGAHGPIKLAVFILNEDFN